MGRRLRPDPLSDAHREMGERIRAFRAAAVWGYKAWHLRRYRPPGVDTQDEWLDALGGIGADIETATKNYLTTRSRKTQAALDLDHWITEGWDDDLPVARTVDPDSHFDLLYVLESLIAASSGRIPDPGTLPFDIGLVQFLDSESGRAQAIMNDLLSLDKWRPLLPDRVTEASEQLVEFWAAFSQLAKDDRARRIIGSDLDPEKVREFRDELAGELERKHGPFDLLMQLCGTREVPVDEAEGPREFGFRKRAPKEWFVSLGGGAAHIGASYGGALWRDFGRKLVDELIAFLPEVQIDVNGPVEDLLQRIGDLDVQGQAVSVIVFGSWRLGQSIQNHPEFHPSGLRDPLEPIGHLRSSAIYDEPWGEPMVLVADFAGAALVERVAMEAKSSSEEILPGSVRFSVETIDEAKATETVAADERFRELYDDPIVALQKEVLLTITSSAWIRPLDASRGFYSILPEDMW